MKLSLEKINYDYKDLSPVMSEDTLRYHRDKLAAGYIKRFNAGEGDSIFNEAGAFLHNLFFPQLRPPKGSNKPFGSSLSFIEDNYDSFDSFKKEFTKVAMSIQGSGWVYLAKDGKIKIIKNHQIKKDIVLIVDWWEHAWALDYQSEKSKYLKNIWKIINWAVINDRINLTKSSRFNKLESLSKIASKKKTYPKGFRRWLREVYYKNKINQTYELISRIRIANFLFNQESENGKRAIFRRWEATQERAEPPHLKIARLYHRTSKRAADKIYDTGKFTSNIDTSFGTEIYFSNKPSGAISGYGPSLVAVDIPEKYTHIDDEFPDGEKHYRVSAADLLRFGRLVPRSELPDKEVASDTRGEQLGLFNSLATGELKITKFSSKYARKLSDILDIKSNFKDADFWIWRKHNPGKPIREYHPEAIGIKIKEEYLDQLDPRYLYYIFEYYNMSKFWEQYEVGSVIKSIRISDIQNLPLSFLSPGS